MGYIFGTSKTKYSLSSGTVYEWQVRGVCSSDTSDVSAWTTISTFTTLAPCSKPTNTNVTSITNSEATLGWDAVSSATSYDVRFKLVGSPWGSWQYTYGIVPNQLVKNNLNAGTWYHWQVRAVCGTSSNASGFTSYNTFSTTSGSRIGLETSALEDVINIYPNPSMGDININFNLEEEVIFDMYIIDAFGKTIISENDIKHNGGEFVRRYDLSKYPNGVYIIKIDTENNSIIKRIVVQ
tara:strand:- start:929 stop:1642 length:714 start_codon:yes stop_codon:yes gene_type:complete